VHCHLGQNLLTTPPKEFADIYLTVAERLGFPPSETVVFEDCPTAARTAYKAGFMVCGVADKFQNRTLEERYPYCHWCITNDKDACQDCPGRNF
jgi:beta-phosphoglucomutase-like phosphatase (HAD superfamily)